MIGPVSSYQSLYTAMCGQVFSTYKLGRDHEGSCHACQSQFAR